MAPMRTAAAGRRTSRRALIISILVVLVGGVIAFAGTQLLTKHTTVLAVAKDVPVGTTISAEDLTTASVVEDSSLSPIPASDRSQIVGLVAQVGLVKGTLLTRAQVGPSSGFTPGQQLVALPLKPGQFPGRGLTPGQKVIIVATPGDNGSPPNTEPTSSPGSSSTTASGDSRPASIDATVVDVSRTNAATQVSVVDVRVDAADAVQVAQLASTGNIAVILLPAGR